MLDFFSFGLLEQDGPVAGQNIQVGRWSVMYDTGRIQKKVTGDLFIDDSRD